MKNYKNKITYWQNKLNNAINCAPAYYSEENITRALSSLTYFVNKQVEVDFPPLQVEEEIERLNAIKSFPLTPILTTIRKGH